MYLYLYLEKNMEFFGQVSIYLKYSIEVEFTGKYTKHWIVVEITKENGVIDYCFKKHLCGEG